MKKLILGLALLITGSLSVKAQGLEGFVAEKFYVTAAGDNGGNGVNATALPTGSVVWRFYADLAPGWQLLNVYGNDVNPMQITTTTTFFNNYDRGNTFGNQINALQITQAAAYIDSYLSLGGTCSNRLGLTKATDDATNNFAFVAPYLQNNDASAGQPLTARDGSFSTTGTVITPQTVGLSAAQLDNFSQAPVGNSFLVNSPTGGGYFAPAGTGAVGPNADNRVLIAQITSNGVLTYSFNLIIQNTSTLVSEDWVSATAGAGQTLLPALAGTVNLANALPTVSITAPAGGSTYLTGQAVTIDATASDTPPGSITNVEFLVNGVVVGSDNTAPYQFIWTSTVGNKTLTARATDDLGGQTTSTGVNITVGNVIAPTCNITSPVGGATFTEGDLVSISANATDDGTVTQVEFFVNGTSIGIDNTGPSPFTFNWSATQGAATITATATDNNAATTTSAPVSISVFDSSSAYVLVTSSNPCSDNTFCLPLNAISAVDDVIGYDLVVAYDNTKVQPTGVVTVSNDLVTPSWTSTANNIDNANGLMYISVFFNGSAPANAEFNGSGELLCVQFARSPGFLAADTADFAINSLQESYFNGVLPKVVTPGQYITFQEGNFLSSLKFWSDNSSIKYDAANPTTYLITNISGSTASCTPLSATAVQPDLNGEFSYDYANGPYINIDKNIPDAISVQPVVNGFDAFLTRRLLINDATFIPSVYQAVAMDVNTDGVVSAGDLSQINQRAVLIIGEFRQDWNYTPAGTPIPGAGPSKDWLFIDGNSLNADANYVISATFPGDDGVGFSRFRVPQVDFCLEVPIQLSASCNIFDVEEYTGVLIGDVNGNFASNVTGGPFRTADNKVIFDLTRAVSGPGYIDVPVSVQSVSNVNALDFALNFNESKLNFGAVINAATEIETLSNYNTDDKAVRFTSYSLQNYDISTPVVSVRFNTQSSTLTESDLSNVEGFINGDKVAVEVVGTRVGNAGVMVNVYPNPANAELNLVVSEDASMQLMDANGRLVIEQANVIAYQKYQFNTGSLAKGIYMLKVYNNNIVSMKKVVIE